MPVRRLGSITSLPERRSVSAITSRTRAFASLRGRSEPYVPVGTQTNGHSTWGQQRDNTSDDETQPSRQASGSGAVPGHHEDEHTRRNLTSQCLISVLSRGRRQVGSRFHRLPFDPVNHADQVRFGYHGFRAT